MTIFQSLILGSVQGITEFFPISSSGHLIVIPKIFGWGEHPLIFDTTLHFGTALALLVVFWRDLLALFKKRDSLLVSLAFGLIPALVVGFLFGDWFEKSFRAPSWVVIFLLLGSLLMIFAELFLAKDFWRNLFSRIGFLSKLGFIELERLSYFKALIIGIFQSVAFFPGISRSGSTISGGMFMGLNRKSAARFAFLLGIPISLLAGLYEGITSSSVLVVGDVLPLFVGFLSSFVVGLLCIRGLLKFLEKRGLWVFVIYRVFLACVLLLII